MVNKLSKNKDYLSKSKIGDYYRSNKDLQCVPKQFFMNAFDKCKYSTDLSGVPYNKSKQRHTRYVKKEDLLNQVLEDIKVHLRSRKR